MTSPRVLMICHTFPPSAAIAGFRAARFARYLPDFHWQPVVLAMSPSSYLSGKLDPALESTLSDSLVVRRVSAWRPLRGLRRKVVLLFGHGQDSSQASIAGGPPKLPLAAFNGNKGSVLAFCKGLLSWTERLLFATPDSEIAWLLPAFWAALRLNAKFQVKALYCTGPPHSAYLMAVALKIVTRLPLVLDFRDPWARAPWQSQTADRLRRIINRYLEGLCVRAADRVILNTAELCEDFRSQYPHAPTDKFVVVPNGFEPELVDQARELLERHSPLEPNDTFRLCHPGTVYGKRDLRPLISLAGCLSSPERQIQIEQIGDVEHFDLLRAWITEQRLEGHICFTGRVAHAEVLRRMAAANALLIIQPDTVNQVPGKLYEMLPFRKPILAVTGRGATQDVISKYHLGAHAEPDDSEGLAVAFRQISGWSMTASHEWSHNQAITDFDGKTLTHRLADVLNAVTGHALRTDR